MEDNNKQKDTEYTVSNNEDIDNYWNNRLLQWWSGSV